MNLVPVNGLEILHKISFVPLKCHLNNKGSGISLNLYKNVYFMQ